MAVTMMIIIIFNQKIILFLTKHILNTSVLTLTIRHMQVLHVKHFF
jgi:hypothetical protein